jgi:[acyl-carrier-protein] S-malonyltransferase
MSTAFVFPGQGSQVVGMGRQLHESVPAAREVFEEVDDALGEPLSRVIFEGPEDALRLTENTQPALMATSIAALRALQRATAKDLPELCSVVAGHSLGEYAALAAAGSIELGDAARLLRVRGRAMQSAVPVGEGAMAAILGLELSAVEEVAEAASAIGVCDVANDNAPGQVVVSGSRAAVEHAVELAKAKGARRSVLLPVSAPFHCRLLAPAADAVRAALAEVTIGIPSVPVVTNVAATPESAPEVLRARLIEQVTARVRWRESLLAIGALGVGTVVEFGAGRVLTGLTKRILPGVATFALGTSDEVGAFATSLPV